MADSASLNAAVSLPGLPAAVPPAFAPLAAPSTSARPLILADLPQERRPAVTQAPATPRTLPAPSVTPRRTVRTAPAATTTSEPAVTPPYRTNNISTADAEKAVVESQRVLRQLTGVGLGRSPHSFQPALVFRDDLGETHVRMQRLYQGIPVFGEQVVTHMGRDGNMRDLTNAAALTNLNIDVTPAVSAEQALVTARQSFGQPAPDSVGQPELVVVRNDDGELRLAWHVKLTGLSGDWPRHMHYFIDAHANRNLLDYNEIHGFVPGHQHGANCPCMTGRLSAVLERQSLLQSSAAEQPVASSTEPAPGEPSPAPGQPPAFTPAHGLGTSIFSGIVPLATARRADGQYVLRDPTRRGMETRDALGRTNTGAFDADGFPTGSVPLTDTDNAWATPSDDERVRPGVDAHYAAARYDDFLRELFQRSGIDGAGMPGRAVIHVGNRMVNAFYFNGVMWYGDGDGRNAGPLVDKDVAGHEPTHGLTANTSGLIYRNESGALNEAASDIIGSAGFSWFLRNSGRPPEQRDQGIAADYLIGEDTWTPGTPGDALRYMADPTRDRRGAGEGYSRDHYSTRYRGFGDNGGVHLNSGIANNWFYLLANGGTNRTSGQTIEQGIGLEKALRIFYRAHTTYFTPFTNFAQAREATLRAAADLHGVDSPEVQLVGRAWSAVGVETQPAPAPAPAPTPTPTPAPVPSPLPSVIRK